MEINDEVAAKFCWVVLYFFDEAGIRGDGFGFVVLFDPGLGRLVVGESGGLRFLGYFSCFA